MKNIQAIISSLSATELSNGEVLYSPVGFYEEVKKIYKAYMSADDYIIMPYYVLGERKVELYEYELKIQVVESPNFERYLLERTGKSKVNDILKEVVPLQRSCYSEVLEAEQKTSTKEIKQYIEFLYNNNCLKHQIE